MSAPRVFLHKDSNAVNQKKPAPVLKSKNKKDPSQLLDRQQQQQSKLSVRFTSPATNTTMDNQKSLENIVLVPEIQKIHRAEPVYFNVTVGKNRRVKSNVFWNPKLNADLANWIRHRKNVERKTKVAIDDKLPEIFMNKLDNDKRYKEQVNRTKEEKRRVANKVFKERCGKVRVYYDTKVWDDEFQQHLRRSALLSKAVRPNPTTTPRIVTQEIREKTPPAARQSFSRLPPISERHPPQQNDEDHNDDSNEEQTNR